MRNKRESMFSVRVTDEEREELTRAAAAEHMALSEWVRVKALMATRRWSAGPHWQQYQDTRAANASITPNYGGPDTSVSA